MIAQVMCLSAHENMNLIAVGFKDGTVLLIKGNITRDRLSRIKVVHEETEPGVYITGESLMVCHEGIMRFRFSSQL